MRDGFGIPFLAGEAHKLMAVGIPLEEAIDQLAYVCELRSEAIEALRSALTQGAESTK